MVSKDTALRQIDEIVQVIQGNLKAVIPAQRMIATGIAIAAIPLIEYFFNHTLDALMSSIPYSSLLLFGIRTVFYWTLFLGITKKSPATEKLHPLVRRVWNIGILFPLIPILTGAMLGITANTELIMPIMLILIGCLFSVYGIFAPSIVRCTAYAYLIGGIAGIYLTAYHIPALWIYLLEYQAIGCIIMGLILYHEQRQMPKQQDPSWTAN